MTVTVRHATADDLALVRTLFMEYVAAPHAETLFHEYLAQQDFESELADLPGSYARPLGALLLAKYADITVGCIALKPLAASVCEMKRLYVRNEARGLGAGHALVAALIDAAREAGYTHMRLDCMPSMQDAQKLYRSFGFYEIPPYNENPVPGSLFLELALSEARSVSR